MITTNGLDKQSILNSELSFYLQKRLSSQVLQMGQTEGFPSGGLRNNAYLHIISLLKELTPNPFTELPVDKNYAKNHKIMLSDIERSVAANGRISKEPPELKESVKARTQDLLLRFFDKNKHFSYYQGFNSVAEVVALNFESSDTLAILEGISNRLLCEFLSSASFENSVKSFNETIAKIVKRTTGISLQP